MGEEKFSQVNKNMEQDLKKLKNDSELKDL